MNKEKEIEKIESAIAELVYDKSQIKKAYNYYHCVRDADQFKHIEDNYGIGTPTSISFTPLVKKHIDVLVGEYLELEPELQITCKDQQTIDNIQREKQLKINSEVHQHLTKYLKNSLINIILGNQEPVNDPFIEKEIQKIKEDLDESFVSEYEIAAQNILNYVRNSRDVDMKNKMRILFTDLLISGLMYWWTRPTGNGDNVRFEPLNPVDTFVERNPNSFYLNKSRRAVVRRWMSKEQVLLEYGGELSSEAKSDLNKYFEKGSSNDKFAYVQGVRWVHDSVAQSYDLPGDLKSPGLIGGLEVTPFVPDDRFINNSDLIDVYHVEWLEWKDGKMRRHEGVKIGSKIYITRGEVENIVRSISDPNDCSLSINGMFFSDRNGQPFSLIISTMDLQDKYDLLLFYRDNLIATSGTVGDWIDVAHMPNLLGADFTERFEKWKAYKKNGVALYDSSQEGANLLNTTFNGFDDTIKVQSIQAVQLAIDSVEQQVSTITGVFQEKLGGIQQRDAVSNVKVGIRQSTLLTKQYFSAMDLAYKEVNYDILNLAKIVFKEGLCGTIILGNKLNKIFTALPEHYTVTDFDIHIQDSTESFQTRNELRALNIELIKAGAADLGTAVNIATAKNVTDLKRYIEGSIARKESENNYLQQMQQQLEQSAQEMKQLQQQIQELTNENKNLSAQIQKNSETKLQIEQQRANIEQQEANATREHNKRIADIKEKQLQIEFVQLTDGNPYNDVVRDV